MCDSNPRHELYFFTYSSKINSPSSLLLEQPPLLRMQKISILFCRKCLIWLFSSVQQPLSLLSWVAFLPWKQRGWAFPKMALSYRDGNGKHHQTYWDSLTFWNSNSTRFGDTVNWRDYFTSAEWEFKKLYVDRRKRTGNDDPLLGCPSASLPTKFGQSKYERWKTCLLSPS